MLNKARELQDCIENMNLIANMQEQVKNTITRASASGNEWAKELQQHTNLQQQVNHLKRTVSWQGVHIRSLTEEQNQTKQMCNQLREENKLYKEMEQEHISVIRKAVGKEEAAAKKIKELQAALQKDSEQLEKLKVEKAGLEKEQGKLLATQAKLMDRRRENQMAFSRKDHILREPKANHDKLKGLLLPAMVRTEALHQENTLLKSKQGDDEDDVLMLPVEGQ
ncbi:hypothetical protein L7F22_057074 [Adiantum nelumboides]|nr:hypothetical protein [Adiantum nelumboides]